MKISNEMRLAIGIVIFGMIMLSAAGFVGGGPVIGFSVLGACGVIGGVISFIVVAIVENA